MIVSFGDKTTKQIWIGEEVHRVPIEIQKIGRRKLRMLNSSHTLIDLKIPPSNRLEKLSGELKEFYSIRINDRWRITFRWSLGSAEEVRIIDYH